MWKKRPHVVWFSVVLVLLLVVTGVVLSCGDGDGDGETPTPTPTPTATPTPTPTPDPWYWKPDVDIDYAPSGVPDFDQKQDAWTVGGLLPAPPGKWSHCGPVAVANSLWYWDSVMEDDPQPPSASTINDHYPLVQTYGVWDDHWSSNVDPLVRDLAFRMDTDGLQSGGGHQGTFVESMEAAIDQYLIDKGLDWKFYEVTVKSPEFDWIEAEVERCEDVILLLGFWQTADDGVTWTRSGGHYVTVAGVNSSGKEIALSDPYLDHAEAGNPGRVRPAGHAPHPGDPTVHNDAKNISHDIYKVVVSDSPGGKWALADYPATKSLVENFEELNFAYDLLYYEGPYVEGLDVCVEIDYAVAVSPMPVEPKLDFRAEHIAEAYYEVFKEGETMYCGIYPILIHPEWECLIYDMEVFFWGDMAQPVKHYLFADVEPFEPCMLVEYPYGFYIELQPGDIPVGPVILHFTDPGGGNLGNIKCIHYPPWLY